MGYRSSGIVERRRHGTVPWVMAGFVAIIAGLACQTAPCTYVRVEIRPLNDETPHDFGGRQGRIEIGFVSERPEAMVEQFPEPPVWVRDVESGRECRIEDGGIWVRTGVYVTGDGDVLMMQEYSGSNEWLAFYDTSDCRKLSEIDIAGARWVMEGRELRIGSNCAGESIKTCKTVRSEALDGSCVPISGR